jgi:thymidylate synthase
MENNIDEQYIDLLKDVLENGVEKNTRNGKVLSVFGRTIRYKFKDGKFPLLTTKKIYFKGVVAELLWFLRGDTSVKFLHDNNCHIWDGDLYKNYKNLFENRAKINGEFLLTKEEFVEKLKNNSTFLSINGNFGPIYPKQWRNWSSFEEIKTLKLDLGKERIEKSYYEKRTDQIFDLIKNIRKDPDDRGLKVSAWNVNDLEHMVLRPCHTDFQVYTRELSLEERIKLVGTEEYENYTEEQRIDFTNTTLIPTRAISLIWNQRSVDTFLGLPFNIASYGLLLSIIAETVRMVPDELIGNLGDTHLYLNHIEQAQEQITRDPYELSRLTIDSEEWSWLQSKDLNFDRFINSMKIEDFKIENYTSHPTIKAPLSN